MIVGTFNAHIGFDIAEAKAKREQKGHSPCIYYRIGMCSCRPQPRCPHFYAGMCVGHGNCSDYTRHYEMPAALVSAQAGLF